MLNPTHDRRMRERKSTLGHHFYEVSKAELEPQIPAHAENDDLPVEMTALEKIISIIQLADRLSDAFCRVRRAWRQGILRSENPYGCGDKRALAWDLGWQSGQANDELSEYVNSKSYELPIELDSEGQRRALGLD
jgi:hypothetical protein